MFCCTPCYHANPGACRWHCDIKPANIIYCNNGKRRGWKIGDPGFATFVEEKLANSQGGLPVIRGKGGTSAYGEQTRPQSQIAVRAECASGGPEGADGGHAPVSQHFDIWSLGCVFSEAATWIALGYRGIKLFQLVRKSGQLGDINFIEQGKNPESVSSVSDIDDVSLMGIHGRDQFHDGAKMSSTVKDWHAHVRQALRRCDPVTEKILGIVESDMLQADPKNRGSAPVVAEKVRSCLALARSNAKSAALYKIPSYFTHAINQEQQQESEVIQERMAREGSEEWRYKYRSRAFIEATKEPLLAGTQLGERSDSLETDSPLFLRSPMMNNKLQRSSASFPRFGRNSRNTFSEPPPLRTKYDNSQSPLDISHADFMQARRLLEEAGWNSGTLEIPQNIGMAEGTITSPKSPHKTKSLDNSTSSRPSQGPGQLLRTKSNRRTMSLVRKLIGTTSKLKSTNFPDSSACLPAEAAATNVRTEPTATQAGPRMGGRENSEHSIHRYETFDSYFKGRDIVK